MGNFEGKVYLEAFLLETEEYIKKLEQLLLDGKKVNVLSSEALHEIFRIVHNTKGSAAMMNFGNIVTLTHALEDFLAILREQKGLGMLDFSSFYSLLFDSVACLKIELAKIRNAENNPTKSNNQFWEMTSKVKEISMSIKLAPLDKIFCKMESLVCEMSIKLNKQVELEILGGETEVSRNIFGNLSAPLMHLVRNAIDHGIETAEERSEIGKAVPAKVTLEAKMDKKEIIITVRDNGRGLDYHNIFKRALSLNLLSDAQGYPAEQELAKFIFQPGFSTKEAATEFSGRGVGLDVVKCDIELMGGVVLTESTPGEGTAITLKIPL